MNKRLLVTLVLLFSLVPNLRGQQPVQSPSPSPVPEQPPAAQPQTARDDDQDVVRITTSLVQIDAVVTKDGKQVTDLKAEDFEIFEDGKPQTITQFSYVSNVPVASATVPKIAAASPRDPKGPPVVPVRVQPNEVRRTVALVIDDLGISGESVSIVKQQLRKFLDTQLQPNDLVSIVNTGGSEVGALQQFTTDKRLLSSAVERLRWNPCSRGGTNVFGGAGARLCSTGTLGRSMQVLRFVLQGMRDLPGRKSMVVFSGSMPYEEPGVEIVGFENTGVGSTRGQLSVGKKSDDPGIGDQLNPQGSTSSTIASLQRITELAIRASVVIYTSDTRGLQVTGWQAMDRNPIAQSQHERDQQTMSTLSSRSAFLTSGREGAGLMARETGGFSVYNSNDFGMQRVMDDQRGYYLIGYRPNDETFNRRFHQIKVRAKGNGLEVRTRKGFYGITEEEAKKPELTTPNRMAKALMSPFGANDVSIRLTTIFANDPVGGSLLRSFLFLDARDLVFQHLPDGTHEASFDLATIIFGDYGKVINRQDEKVKLRLRQARYDQVLREGIVYKFDRPVKQPGGFQFRVALHDTSSFRIGAAGQFIEAPDLRSNRLALSGILLGSAGSLADDVRKGPAVRRFPQGSPLTLGYTVYNAVIDKNTHLPQLTAQTRIYRDGQVIFTGTVTPLDPAGQTDLQRIVAVAQLELGVEFSPGEYVLQIIVSDRLAKEKQGTASQWIDFEVVK
jgi:VWFA-related protein